MTDRLYVAALIVVFSAFTAYTVYAGIMGAYASGTGVPLVPKHVIQLVVDPPMRDYSEGFVLKATLAGANLVVATKPMYHGASNYYIPIDDVMEMYAELYEKGTAPLLPGPFVVVGAIVRDENTSCRAGVRVDSLSLLMIKYSESGVELNMSKVVEEHVKDPLKGFKLHPHVLVKLGPTDFECEKRSG